MHVDCQGCGTAVSRAFARVFGAPGCELFACPGCATRDDLRRCAGSAPDADGTLLVHRPDADEPQPAVFSDDDGEPPDDRERLSLADLRDRQTDSHASDPTAGETTGSQHDDGAFEAVVAK